VHACLAAYRFSDLNGSPCDRCYPPLEPRNSRGLAESWNAENTLFLDSARQTTRGKRIRSTAMNRIYFAQLWRGQLPSPIQQLPQTSGEPKTYPDPGMPPALFARASCRLTFQHQSLCHGLLREQPIRHACVLRRPTLTWELQQKPYFDSPRSTLTGTANRRGNGSPFGFDQPLTWAPWGRLTQQLGRPLAVQTGRIA